MKYPIFILTCSLVVRTVSAADRAASSPENSETSPAVTVDENESTFTLANEVISAKVAKRSGDLVSLRFKNLELLGSGSGHGFGYWSHDVSRGRHSAAITIDPKTNGG